MAQNKKRHWCGQCERHEHEAGPISRRGLCMDCATGNSTEYMLQLAAGRGPMYDRWREGMRRAVERTAQVSDTGDR